jgi:SAM-dependent methyltransferase
MALSTDEALRLGAPLARRLAPATCYRDPRSGETCAWSHGIWLYLRVLGLNTTPQDQAVHYHRGLGEYASLGRAPRILVSGAADFGMLAEVIAAFRPRGVEPEVLVTDICETPLAVNRWYAERAGLRISTERTDILELRRSDAFDAICTHSFFGRFSPERRPALIETWRRLLRPGGAVITVNRIRSDAHGRAAFAAGHAEKFRELVARGVREAVPPLDVAPEALAAEAEAYARQPGGHAVNSREELEALFTGGGLRIEHFEVSPVARAAASRELRGPTLPGGALYGCLVAKRAG